MGIDPKDRYKFVVGVHFLFFRDNKTLLGKRKNTGFADGYFHMIGGHVEDREFLTTALVREMREELGVIINPKELKLVHIKDIRQSDHSRIHLYFTADSWEGEIVNNEPNNCEELKWFSLDALPENITKDTKETLKAIENNIIYSETDQP